jgi:hypothetical protein
VRRCLAVAGAVLCWFPLALGPRAGAHEDHLDFKWEAPAEAAAAGSVHITARVGFEDGVGRWMAEAVPPDGDQAAKTFGVLCSGDGRGSRSVTLECDWETTAYSDDSISRNGAYRLRVTAWNAGRTQPDRPAQSGQGSDGSGQPEGSRRPSQSGRPRGAQDETRPASAGEAHVSPDRTVTVANPPAAPEAVRLAYDESTSRVTLTWQANREPDIVGYLVNERYNSEGWALVAKPVSPSWTNQLSQPGTYEYQVAAVRSVGSSNRLVTGPFQSVQSGPRRVQVGGGDDGNAAPPQRGDSTTTQPPSSSRWRRSAGGYGETTTTTGPATTTTTVGSVTTTYDPGAEAAAAAADRTGAPAAVLGPPPAGGLPRPVLSPIAAGKPGSVEVHYGTPAALSEPLSPEEAFDPGFSQTLPYPREVRLALAPPPEPPKVLGTVVLFQSDEDQQRALVGVLAGGLVIFMLGMQVVYLNHRPRLPDLASTDWD